MPPMFELDKWDLKRLYDYWKRGRLSLQPEYQRGKVWPDHMKYALVDTILHDWPMGLIMMNVVPHADEDGVPTERYEVVDGQQRFATLFDYRDGVPWGDERSQRRSGFVPFARLSPARRQDRFDEYKVAIALMREFEQDDIWDIYSRLQNSKPLRAGERVKGLPTHFKPHLRALADHRLFSLGGGKFRVRDAHWNLAAIFFKSVYSDKLLDRQEYPFTEGFLRTTPYDEARAQRAQQKTSATMTFEYNVIEEARQQEASFLDTAGSPRLLKWLFAALTILRRHWALTGREHLVARGLLAYYHAKDVEQSDEWVAYLNTGRTGRIDTDDVRACLEQLMNRIIIESQADPLDPNRFFTAKQREEILEQGQEKCAKCGIELSKTRFHADHIVPHSQGGKTEVANGQPLCTACNRKKGGNRELFADPAASP